MTSSPPASFIYVVARRHSGSTILDILLGHAADTTSLGELGHSLAVGDHLCSCGSKIGECPFWNAVARAANGGEKAFAAAGDTVRKYSPIWNFPKFLVSSRHSDAVQSLMKAHRVVLDALARATGSSHFVDSSKGLPRALALARFDPSARILQLVRHPYGAVASYRWRIQANEGFPLFGQRHHGPVWSALCVPLGAAFWTIGNLLAEVVSAFAGGRSIRVRYEDLCTDPAAELRRVGRFCSIDTEPAIARLERGEPFAVGHNIGGNRIRFDRKLVLDPSRDRGRELPLWARAVTLAICWPLMWWYGYTMTGRSRRRHSLLLGERA